MQCLTTSNKIQSTPVKVKRLVKHMKPNIIKAVSEIQFKGFVPIMILKSRLKGPTGPKAPSKVRRG